MRAVFGLAAGWLLSGRAGCGLGGCLWQSARAAHFWLGRSAVGCLVSELAVAGRVLCLLVRLGTYYI